MTKRPATKPTPPAPQQPEPTWQPSSDDIVDDMLRVCLALAPSFSAALAEQAGREIRERWGGDRVYIARRQGGGTSERNAAILRDHKAGERPNLLARRYRLSRTQIWEILRNTEKTKA